MLNMSRIKIFANFSPSIPFDEGFLDEFLKFCFQKLKLLVFNVIPIVRHV